MLWLTTSFFFVEIVVGYITNSMSLVADSFHMLSDVAALVVAFVSVRVSFQLFFFSFSQLSEPFVVDVAEKMGQKHFRMG